MGEVISVCPGLVELDESSLLMIFVHKVVVAQQLTLG